MSQPASAAGAEEEEHAAWADALDVDDSGFLRRGPASSPSPLRSCAAPRPDDPAPAASLAHDADAARGLHLASSGHGQAADPDFSLAPWLHALGSLGESGGGRCPDQTSVPPRRDARAWKRQEIAAIRRDRALYRARLVVGMVTSCTRNRLGDLFLSLKDPSGTIGASVHQKVFTKEDNMVVSVGSVIVLKNVAVFRPSHKGCYLNITEENLEMLVPKDFFPPKQVFSSSPSESQHPVKCAETRGSSCQGDNHTRKTGADTYGQTTANDVRDSMLRMDKGSTQGVGNHQDIRLREKDINPSNKNTPSYSANQQFQNTSCSSGKHQGIELQTLMQRLGSRHISNRNGEEHHQQTSNVPENPNTRCSQSTLGGCSVMSRTGNSNAASSDEKLSRPVEGERMLPNSKKQRGDAVLLDNVMSGMNIETYGLTNNLNIGLDNVAQVLVEHDSIKKPNELQQKDFIAGTLGIVLPTQENSSVSNSDATTVSASLHSQPNKITSLTEWTDDQLSELFADY
uniref:Homologous recombination OB-fold protein OB-fold domain-containing protein n=1 Tax=Oryza punctata TaxID=4537 RepID=A0A0E0LJ35_ORYPU